MASLPRVHLTAPLRYGDRTNQPAHAFVNVPYVNAIKSFTLLMLTVLSLWNAVFIVTIMCCKITVKTLP